MIDLRRYRHDDVTPELKQTLVAVHADAYADAMDDPFNQRFAWFVDHWSSNPGFSCVLGYEKDEPIGLAYGASAVPQREWWREHWTPEGDSSTFALSELMVRPKWRKTGAGQQLHDALLEDRTEALAVLLVDTTHPRGSAPVRVLGLPKGRHPPAVRGLPPLRSHAQGLAPRLRHAPTEVLHTVGHLHMIGPLPSGFASPRVAINSLPARL